MLFLFSPNLLRFPINAVWQYYPTLYFFLRLLVVFPPFCVPTHGLSMVCSFHSSSCLFVCVHVCFHVGNQVAYGFIRVANEAMCRPIRNLTTMKVRANGYRIIAKTGPSFVGPTAAAAVIVFFLNRVVLRRRNSC